MKPEDRVVFIFFLYFLFLILVTPFIEASLLFWLSVLSIDRSTSVKSWVSKLQHNQDLVTFSTYLPTYIWKSIQVKNRYTYIASHSCWRKVSCSSWETVRKRTGERDGQNIVVVQKIECDLLPQNVLLSFSYWLWLRSVHVLQEPYPHFGIKTCEVTKLSWTLTQEQGPLWKACLVSSVSRQ